MRTDLFKYGQLGVMECVTACGEDGRKCPINARGSVNLCYQDWDLSTSKQASPCLHDLDISCAPSTR